MSADQEPAVMPTLAHLNLTVTELDRSVAFYARWFGFDQRPHTMPDGTRFLRNDDGFDLALRPGRPPWPPAPMVHIGFRATDADEVRTFLAELKAADVPISETHDEPGHASVKCLDPDGYEIEIYWDQ
jgi:catechol 2,3-dioxygenase-like lactoylglutathione lyase family enzyme